MATVAAAEGPELATVPKTITVWSSAMRKLSKKGVQAIRRRQKSLIMHS